MARVHSLAVVDPAADLADDVEVGPFCVIGADVSIGEGCRLISHVVVESGTTIGPRTIVHPHAVLGGAPQSLSYKGEPTRLVIGADCVLRESVTMSRGTAAGGGVTTVGDHGFFMAYAHVAHDCHVGSHVIFANTATLGGHCIIGDHVFIGGLSAVLQFSRIGAHAMIGGMCGIRSDVIPFGMTYGDVARLAGVNVVGMRRRGFSRESIAAVRKAYRMLFFAPGSKVERVDAVDAELGTDPAVAQIVSFVREATKRPLCQPDRTQDE